MKRLTGLATPLLGLVALALLVLVLGAWIDAAILMRVLPSQAQPVVDYLHAKPFADWATLAGFVIAFLAFLVQIRRRSSEPGHAAPAVAPDPAPAIPPPAPEITGSVQTDTNPSIATSRFLLRHNAGAFVGRERELALLDAAWAERSNVLALIAWGGVGKTALLAQWIGTRFIDKKNWRDPATGKPLLDAYFDWSFYDQGTRTDDDDPSRPVGARAGSVGNFFEQALAHFGDTDPTQPGKGARLARLVQQQRTLFVLDGLEPLQAPPVRDQAGGTRPGELLDPDLAELIRALAQNNPGLLLITSRQALPELAGTRAATRQEELTELSRDAAVRLLRQLQVTGTEDELAAACERLGCHALSIELVGRFLVDAHRGDIRRMDRIRDLHQADRDTRDQRRRTAWNILAAYEQWLGPPPERGGLLTRARRRVRLLTNPKARAEARNRDRTLAVLRLTGLFDRPADPASLAALRQPPAIRGLTDALTCLDERAWEALLRDLERARLIRRRVGADDRADERAGLDAHPLIREYFAEQLRSAHPEAFRTAHARLFEHLCQTTPHRPDTLEGLQPLYQAVRHGVLAGREEEARKQVYIERILRGAGPGGFFSRRKLGAIGQNLSAVAAFFDEPWGHVSPRLAEPHRAWLLNEAAFYLRAQGRLTEALEPMRVVLERDVQQKAWKQAAISAGNLSELELTLGLLPAAVADARQAVAHAERSGDAFWRMASRTTAADALHQSGERAEAGALFQEAEGMQRQRQPEFPLLYSLPGFRYCDWLLAPAERAAWRLLLRGAGFQPATGTTGVPPAEWDQPTAPAPTPAAAAEPSPTAPATPEPTGAPADPATLDPPALDPPALCDEAERRATTTLGWGKRHGSLLDIALDHLTLARAALLRALLADPGSPPDPAAIAPALAEAQAGLRDAGTKDHLPKALLTAAWHHALRGEPDPARAALDEALDLALRGPMPLYQADALLLRARLWLIPPRAGTAYPWPDTTAAADLAEARRLIEQTGYHRRLPGLQDAEAALHGVSPTRP